MKTLKLLALTFFLTSPLFSQLDTTNWYPLQTGNKWLYTYGLEDVYYYTTEVIGDTIMPNGISYQILDIEGNLKYQRNLDNKYVFEYAGVDTPEILLYDFISPDRTIWKSKQNYDYYGIFLTGSEYGYFHNVQTQYKLFDYVQIDSSFTPPDTIFGAIIDVFPTKITQGIGVISYGYNNTPGFPGLAAAIINGDTLGTFTNIKNQNLIQNYYNISQNYPNPFNPTTTIEFVIPKTEYVEINIFNSLGQKVQTLLNKIISSGFHNIQFDGKKFSSGIYFYQIKTENYCESKKMILLK
ncbi:MAG: T9SS type A sorting domain-containing protein [bacterium]